MQKSINAFTIIIITSLLILFIHFHGVLCDPPGDPIKCTSPNNINCTITNSYGVFPDRSMCRAARVLYPTTEAELVSIVTSASKSNTKLKVATRYSHSIPKLACPGGEAGILISTNLLNRTLKVDVAAMTITVESGVMLRDVISEASKSGLALPNAPYWWGITVGGLLATGAHGSSLWGKGSAVHEYVKSLRIVTPSVEDGYAAKVRVLTEGDDDEELNAAKVSLGVLGVISQVTLKFVPMFKRSLTYVKKDDSDLGEELVSFGKENEFGDVMWYPSQKKAVYRVDGRVSVNQLGNGLFDFVAFRSSLIDELLESRATEELQEATRDANGKCQDGKVVIDALQHSAYGLTNNGVIFTGYPVIGYNDHIQSSGTCLDNDEEITICPWDSKFQAQFFYLTTFSVPLSNVTSFIKDIQKLVELEPQSLCGLEINNGILLRFVKASSAYLGKTEDVVDFAITYYRSKDPLTPRLFEDIIEEIEQMGLFKYGGLPHWGKNRNIAFEKVINKYPNADKFLRVKQKYDPQGIFSSEWTNQILGLKEGVMIVKDGCALEGLCICSEDRHCAPSKNYYCRPGRVYKKARVCAFENEKIEGKAHAKEEL